MGVREEGLDMSTTQKEGHFMEEPLHFCPSIQLSHICAETSLPTLKQMHEKKNLNAKVRFKIEQMCLRLVHNPKSADIFGRC